MSQIVFNQLGFQPKNKKRAFYDGPDKKFFIKDANSHDIVFSGDFQPTSSDGSTDCIYKVADFTRVNDCGVYYICLESGSISESFAIARDVYDEAFNALNKFFYYQRCGCELEADYAGPWKHDACHTDFSEFFPESREKLDMTGGWHDAGDYGRYTVAAAKAVADLLLAYERFGNAFKRQWHIPESHLPMDDVLWEVKYELEWLLKMQDTKTGGVYHKVTSRHFCGMVMPENDHEATLVFDISSSATAMFGAVMAMAYDSYYPYDVAFAKKCLSKAYLAEKWIGEHPEQVLFKNPENVLSGEYSDSNDADERYWLYAQLFKTTGQTAFYDKAKKLAHQVDDLTALSWNDCGGYGSLALLKNNGIDLNDDFMIWIKDAWMTRCQRLIVLAKTTTFGITLKLHEYIWGSNMLIGNYAMTLIYGHDFTQDEKYLEPIQNLWDYLVGMNPLGISYITGIGTKQVMHPHHRPSEDDQVIQPVPGMLLGGPCSLLQDEAARKYLAGAAPAHCFVDHMESYSTNEMTVYWNSVAVFLSAFFVEE